MKHCIIAKFKPGIYGPTLFEELRAHFAPAVNLDGVESVTLHPNVVNKPNRADLLILLTMSPEALPIWAECDIHKEWKRRWGDLLEAKTILDID